MHDVVWQSGNTKTSEIPQHTVPACFSNPNLKLMLCYIHIYIYTHASEYIVTSCNVCGSISFRTSADDAPFSKTKISCYFKLGFTRDLDIASATFELWLRNPSSTEAGRRNIGKNSFLPRATRTSHNLSLLSHTQSNKQ